MEFLDIVIQGGASRWKASAIREEYATAYAFALMQASSSIQLATRADGSLCSRAFEPLCKMRKKGLALGILIDYLDSFRMSGDTSGFAKENVRDFEPS